MKKHRILFGIAILTTIMMTACSKPTVEPEISQIRNICNLATLECYFHNVAKSEKTAGTGITHLGEVNRSFWIEYTGTVKLGIDLNKIDMNVTENKVEITLPQAEVLGTNIDTPTLNENSYIISQDSFFNKNKITAEEQITAIDEAQKKMEKTVSENTALLTSAQNRAKALIENYITQLGEAAGQTYTIVWK